MKKTLAAAAALISLSSAASAQSAMEMALQGNYCNGSTPVAAEFLPAPDGRLKITCPAGSLSGQNVLGASGLQAGQGLGLAVAGLAVIVAIGGGDDDAVVTSTTTGG